MTDFQGKRYCIHVTETMKSVCTQSKIYIQTQKE
jgi:hypothetical protein